jgi:hypothetical protein
MPWLALPSIAHLTAFFTHTPDIFKIKVLSIDINGRVTFNTEPISIVRIVCRLRDPTRLCYHALTSTPPSPQ